jgi:septum formation inhibitor-activating ATPase MinD
MRTSVVPSCGVQSPPHVVVIGNQKGGSGKTASGQRHGSRIAHGIADTLVTPINDSLVDLDVLVAIERSNQPSVYAKTVRRAVEARCKVSGRATLDRSSEPTGTSRDK